MRTRSHEKRVRKRRVGGLIPVEMKKGNLSFQQAGGFTTTLKSGSAGDAREEKNWGKECKKGGSKNEAVLVREMERRGKISSAPGRGTPYLF